MSNPRDRVGGSSSERRARAVRRRQRIVANRADSFEAAELWDLDFWQARTPQERLSALVHLRRDVELAQAARDDRDGDRR